MNFRASFDHIPSPLGRGYYFPGLAGAHLPGGFTNVTRFNARLGPYLLEVTIVPRVPEPGRVSEIVAGIKEENTGQLFNGQVIITALKEEGNFSFSSPATKFQEGYYEIRPVFPQEGQHRVTVTLESHGTSYRSQEFIFQVAYSSLNLLLLLLSGAILGAAILLVLVIRARRGPAKAHLRQG